MKINQGATLENKGMILGAAMAILGIYIINNSGSPIGVIPGILLILIGALTFPWIIQAEIDKPGKTIRRKVMIGPVGIPIKTYDISETDSVTLKLFSQNQRMNNLSQSSNVRTRTYEITVNTKKQKILVSDSTDYDKSLKTMEQLGELLEVETENKYEKMKASLQERGRTRR